MVVCAWLAAEDPTSVHRRHLLEPICREGRLPGMGTEADYRKWFSDANLEIGFFEDLSARVRKTWSICLVRVLRNVLSASEIPAISFQPRRAQPCLSPDDGPHLARLSPRGDALRPFQGAQAIGIR